MRIKKYIKCLNKQDGFYTILFVSFASIFVATLLTSMMAKPQARIKEIVNFEIINDSKLMQSYINSILVNSGGGQPCVCIKSKDDKKLVFGYKNGSIFQQLYEDNESIGGKYNIKIKCEGVYYKNSEGPPNNTLDIKIFLSSKINYKEIQVYPQVGGGVFNQFCNMDAVSIDCRHGGSYSSDKLLCYSSP